MLEVKAARREWMARRISAHLVPSHHAPVRSALNSGSPEVHIDDEAPITQALAAAGEFFRERLAWDAARGVQSAAGPEPAEANMRSATGQSSAARPGLRHGFQFKMSTTSAWR